MIERHGKWEKGNKETKKDEYSRKSKVLNFDFFFFSISHKFSFPFIRSFSSHTCASQRRTITQPENLWGVFFAFFVGFFPSSSFLNVL